MSHKNTIIDRMPTIETALGPWERDCSGIIISRYHVITTMACGWDTKAEKVEIWVGKFMIAESKSIWPWNKPKPTTHFKNFKYGVINKLINIIELKDPLELSDDVQPICLSDDDDVNQIDKLVYTVWEKQKQGSKDIQILKQSSVSGKGKMFDYRRTG